MSMRSKYYKKSIMLKSSIMFIELNENQYKTYNFFSIKVISGQMCTILFPTLGFIKFTCMFSMATCRPGPVFRLFFCHPLTVASFSGSWKGFFLCVEFFITFEYSSHGNLLSMILLSN